MSVRTRIALGTLCVFNAITVVALGFIALLYVDGAPGPISAGALWSIAAGLIALSRWLRHGTEW